MNRRQLTFAREFRGYSQSDLSNAINGLSQPNLSKYEKGFGFLSKEVQESIAKFLDFPIEFFELEIGNKIVNGNYRKRSTVTKNLIQNFEYSCKLVGYIIDELSQTIDWPEAKYTPINVEEGYSPEYIAQFIRRKLKIDSYSPVKNIFKAIESLGIIIYELPTDIKFDGVSFITDKGFPLIVINKNFPNDRKRFTLAHELGHILMHNEHSFIISEYRDKEKEANSFAAEFLMPEESCKNNLRGIKFNDLADYKQYWLTSMAFVIRRAYDLGCINKNEYTYFNIQMSRFGYSKVEPVKVFIDEPVNFNKSISLMETELEYTFDDLLNYFTLPKDIVNSLILQKKSNMTILT